MRGGFGSRIQSGVIFKAEKRMMLYLFPYVGMLHEMPSCTPGRALRSVRGSVSDTAASSQAVPRYSRRRFRAVLRKNDPGSDFKIAPAFRTLPHGMVASPVFIRISEYRFGGYTLQVLSGLCRTDQTKAFCMNEPRGIRD